MLVDGCERPLRHSSALSTVSGMSKLRSRAPRMGARATIRPLVRELRPVPAVSDAQGRLPTPEPVPFMVEVHRGGCRPLIKVSGELDQTTAPLLAAMLDHVRTMHPAPVGNQRGDAPACTDIDLSGVTFADSHGLAPVLDDHAAVLIAASGRVRRVVHLLQPHRPYSAAAGSDGDCSPLLARSGEDEG